MILMSVIAIAGYLAYQQYFHSQTQAIAGTRIAVHPKSSGLPMGSGINEAGTESVGVNGLAMASSQVPPSAAQQQPDINDTDAVPIPAPATQRGVYMTFLSQPSPRAFVICSNGRVMAFVGTKFFVEKRLSLLPAGCKPYAIDNAVVWGSAGS